MPTWMKDYFSWHREQRKLIRADNWDKFKYIVMVCSSQSEKCGGIVDRLRPIPFIVRVAAETKRILLIKWERPATLESFLMPPHGGVYWQTPKWMVPHIESTNVGTAKSVKKLVEIAAGKEKIVKSQVQAHDYGSKYYNNQALEYGDEVPDAFRRDYRDCWYSMFTPVPEIARKVEGELERLKLVPGGFSFAHVRASYGIEGQARDPALVKNWTQNSLNCASNLQPGGPYFFASDSMYSKQVAIEYGQEKNVPVVTRLDDKDALYLDLDGEIRDRSEYFPIVVDLYLMSMAKCYTYNMGGYAEFANLISGSDFTCNVRHWTAGVDPNSANKNGCQWMQPTKSKQSSTSASAAKLTYPLFLAPTTTVT